MKILIILSGLLGFISFVSAFFFNARFPEGARKKYWILRKLHGTRVLLSIIAIISIGCSLFLTIYFKINSGETIEQIDHRTHRTDQTTQQIKKMLQETNHKIIELEKALEPVINNNISVGELSTPQLSKEARELAPHIPDDAGPYALAIKAIAQERFDDADNLLDQPTKQQEAELAKIYIARGNSKYYQGKYHEALHWSKKALSLHPGDPVILNQVGLYSTYAGEYIEAEPLLKRALKIRENQLNPDQRNIADSLNNLAGLYESQSEYEQAESLYLRAIEINEKDLGKDHPRLAIALNNLANLYRVLGKYERAKTLFLRVIKINEKMIGSKHTNHAITLNNLALLYKTQGKYEQAKPLYIQAIEIDEKTLGKDHPQLATHLNNLAELYRSQGKYEQAEPLYLRAIEIDEKTLPDDHPNLLLRYENYAIFLQETGREAEAREYESKAQAIHQKRGE
jgi:tetratricopeptide (TPR) repeat protein